MIAFDISDTRRSPNKGIHALSLTAAYTDKVHKTSMDEDSGHVPDASMSRTLLTPNMAAQTFGSVSCTILYAEV